MRLVLLSSEFPPGPGGIGSHAYQLAWHLFQLGWEIVVISPQDYASEGEIRAFNEPQQFSIVRLRPVPGAPLKAVYRCIVASKRIKEWRPDILLASGDRAVWLAAWLSGRHRLPLVAVGHGTEFGKSAAWERKLTRWSFQRAAAVVCVSQYTWQQMLASRIKPRKGRVIPNGADSSVFKVLPAEQVKQVRLSLGLNADKVLLTVGQVTERKGQEVVIRAMPLILSKAPNTHYLIAGLPTRRGALMRLAQELGVADFVHFLGRVDSSRLVGLLNCCDLFVMTSRRTPGGDFEGYGIAVVEAALCGKPAVVSASSGLTEAIVEGETGLAVPEGDEGATAQAIVSLLKAEGQRTRMGKAALKRASEEQTWEFRVKQYDLLLRSLLTPSIALPLENLSETVRELSA